MNENLQKIILNVRVSGESKKAGINAEQILLSDGSTAAETIASILTDISNLPTDSGIDAKIQAAVTDMKNQILGLTDADTTIDEAYDTLKEVAAWIDEHGETAAAFSTDITALKTAVQALQDAGATKVEASETNGNIKINGVETTVFTMPETISADKITETTEKQFVTAAEKSDWNSRGAVHVGETEPEDMKDGDLFIQLVS